MYKTIHKKSVNTGVVLAYPKINRFLMAEFLSNANLEAVIVH